MGTVAANLRIISEISKYPMTFLYLHIHFNPIHLKDAHISKLPDLIRVQQLHSSCAFVEVIFEGDAAMPVLDLAAARPETDVDGFGGIEDFAEGGDVDGLHGDSFWD